MSDVEIVTTPTEAWLRQQLARCRRRLLVSSPYVNEAFVDLVQVAPPTAKKVLVTRTDLRDFAMGSSSIESLCSLASIGVQIRRLGDLHAKVYVVDTAVALVTSANATGPGLRQNRECGLAVHDPPVVRRIAGLVRSGFGAEPGPELVGLAELSSLRRPVEIMRDAMPHMPRINIPEAPEHQYAEPFHIPDADKFLLGFTGWRRLTLEGVLAMPRDVFTAAQVYGACVPLARQRYPRNRFPQDKLRQQLQILRDLGLVEFLGGGRYRRNAVPLDRHAL